MHDGVENRGPTDKDWHDARLNALWAAEGPFRYRVGVERLMASIYFEKLQGGQCAICDVELVQDGSGGYCVDHDHTSGLCRGLLCGRCNNGLGQFKDNAERLERAAAYLRGVRA